MFKDRRAKHPEMRPGHRIPPDPLATPENAHPRWKDVTPSGSIYTNASKIKAEAIMLYERGILQRLSDRRQKHPNLIPPRPPVPSVGQKDEGGIVRNFEMLEWAIRVAFEDPKKIPSLLPVEWKIARSVENVLKLIVMSLDNILKITAHYYAYKIFGRKSGTLLLYNTSDSEEELARRFTLLGYTIASIPKIINCLLSDSTTFSLFHQLVSGKVPHDKLCENYVGQSLTQMHKPREQTSFAVKEEFTKNLIIADSFRAHHFRLYFLTPIWIQAICSPHVNEQIKQLPTANLAAATDDLGPLLLKGTAAFAILSLETRRFEPERKR